MSRLIIYEGSDEEILRFLSSLQPQQPHTHATPSEADGPSTSPGAGSSHLEQIARNFRARLQESVANGHKGQMDAVTCWLKRNGIVELTELWQASGVANQHDYGGIGSSLTRNMKKVGGPKNWYTWKRHSTKAGEWIYSINPELVEPLKRAFLG